MKYYLLLLENEIKKIFCISMRYKFNTIFSISFWAILITLISYSIAIKNPSMVFMFASSFMIWLIVNNTFIAVVDSIISESTQGTLEQLYINSGSFYGMLLIKGLSSALLSFVQTIFSVILGIIFIRQLNFDFLWQWLAIVPVIFISIFSLIGAGIACASLSLKYKNISSFYSLISSIFFGIVTYSAKLLDNNVIASILIPFGKANSALQFFFQSNVEISCSVLFYSFINSVLWLIIGYLCLSYYEKKSKKNGLFSKF